MMSIWRAKIMQNIVELSERSIVLLNESIPQSMIKYDKIHIKISQYHSQFKSLQVIRYVQHGSTWVNGFQLIILPYSSDLQRPAPPHPQLPLQPIPLLPAYTGAPWPPWRDPSGPLRPLALKLLNLRPFVAQVLEGFWTASRSHATEDNQTVVDLGEQDHTTAQNNTTQAQSIQLRHADCTAGRNTCPHSLNALGSEFVLGHISSRLKPVKALRCTSNMHKMYKCCLGKESIQARVHRQAREVRCLRQVRVNENSRPQDRTQNRLPLASLRKISRNSYYFWAGLPCPWTNALVKKTHSKSSFLLLRSKAAHRKLTLEERSMYWLCPCCLFPLPSCEKLSAVATGYSILQHLIAFCTHPTPSLLEKNVKIIKQVNAIHHAIHNHVHSKLSTGVSAVAPSPLEDWPVGAQGPCLWRCQDMTQAGKPW